MFPKATTTAVSAFKIKFPNVNISKPEVLK